MNNLLPINEIETLLGYTDKQHRATLHWLKWRGVAVFSIGKKLFVKKQDFERAIEKILQKNQTGSVSSHETNPAKAGSANKAENHFYHRLLKRTKDI